MQSLPPGTPPPLLPKTIVSVLSVFSLRAPCLKMECVSDLCAPLSAESQANHTLARSGHTIRAASRGAVITKDTKIFGVFVMRAWNDDGTCFIDRKSVV